MERTTPACALSNKKAQRETVQGEGNARNLAPGYLFTFSKYPRGDQNKDYLIEAAYYRFGKRPPQRPGPGRGQRQPGGLDSPTSYRLSISAVPKPPPTAASAPHPNPTPRAPRRR